LYGSGPKSGIIVLKSKLKSKNYAILSSRVVDPDSESGSGSMGKQNEEKMHFSLTF
jgi:hypothetical protein